MGCRVYFGTLRSGQDLLLLLQVSGDDHGHVDRIFLEPILVRQSNLKFLLKLKSTNMSTTKKNSLGSNLQVPLDLADVVL